MGNARLLKLFEVIEHRLAKGPSVVELGIFVFQVDRFRLFELVIEQITMREIAIDHHCLIWRKFQSLERSCNRLTRLPIE